MKYSEKMPLYLFYAMVQKKSKMTKNPNQGGSCLKRGQEKCSCTLLSGPGTPFRPLFFRDGNIDKALLPPADRASNERKCASVDEASIWSCSIRKEPNTPLVERRRSGPASQRSLRREARFECNFERIGKGTDLHGRVVV